MKASRPASVYHVTLAVWGEAYVDLFLNVCIPNQLTPGNLDSLPPGSRYRVFTTTADAPTLAASAALARVRALLPVDIVAMDPDEARVDPADVDSRHRYRILTNSLRRAVADAAADEAALLFLHPDFVLAEGMLRALRTIHESGKRAVLTANLRLCRERVVRELKRRGVEQPLPPRVLAGIALDHLHPSIEALMIDSRGRDTAPTAVYWPVRRRDGVRTGVLIRAFHLHPMLLDPVRRALLPRGTIDGHYVFRACPHPEQVHVVTDSDDALAFELTPERSLADPRRGRGISRLRLAAVASQCDPYQHSHWHRPIRLHAGDITEEWIAVEADSERFVRGFEWYRPFGPALFRVFRTYSFTQRRVQRGMRTMGKAFRPRVNMKRYTRSTRLLAHDVAKAWKLRVKQARRTLSGRHPLKW